MRDVTTHNYEIRHPLESVCGGAIHLHRQPNGFRAHWGVEGRICVASREVALSIAAAADTIYPARDWRGRHMGAWVVAPSNYPCTE